MVCSVKLFSTVSDGCSLYCRLIDAKLLFSLKTVHLKSLSGLDYPDCYKFDVEVICPWYHSICDLVANSLADIFVHYL